MTQSCIRLVFSWKMMIVIFPYSIENRNYKNIRQTEWLFFSSSQLPFISTNIPTSPAYGAYISQLIRYSRACAQCSDLLDRAQQPTQKLLKQGNVAPRLKSSLQLFYSCHHNLNYRYEIPISQMTMNLFLFSSISATTFTVLDCIDGFVLLIFLMCVLFWVTSSDFLYDFCIKSMFGDEFMFPWK